MTYTVRVDDSFGDDPFIIGPGDQKFSAWEYAKARSEVLCATVT